MATMAAKGESHVLSNKMASGPHGLGDPDDLSLRKVEIEVLIPKLMREKAKTEKCSQEVKAFEECCKNASVLMVVKCRKENTLLKDCLTSWYQNEHFKTVCQNQYLKERSEYRRTGITKKQKNQNAELK